MRSLGSSKTKRGKNSSLGDLKKAKMGGLVSLGECQTTKWGRRRSPGGIQRARRLRWGVLGSSERQRERSRTSGRDPKRSMREGFRIKGGS